MEYRTDLEAMISSSAFFKHAVATPISTLFLSLELANQVTRSLPNHLSMTLKQNLETSFTAAQRIAQLLEIVRQPHLTKQSISITSLLQELKMYCQTKYSQGQLLIVSQNSTDCSIVANRFLVLETLLCAVTNGFESYSPVAPNKVVSISWRKAQNKLQMHITDGGEGGLTTHSRYLRLGETSKLQHAGLGLSLIQAVIEQHLHGRLEIISPANFGTTLTLLIPL